MEGKRVRATAIGGDPARAGAAPRLYQRVIALLDSQIRQGTLAASAALTESAVAARFGISRAPARRALSELERTGLIARAGARGFVVVARPLRRNSARDGGGGEAAAHDLRLVSQPSWERIYGAVESEIIARISFASWRVTTASAARSRAMC